MNRVSSYYDEIFFRLNHFRNNDCTLKKSLTNVLVDRRQLFRFNTDDIVYCVEKKSKELTIVFLPFK